MTGCSVRPMVKNDGLKGPKPGGATSSLCLGPFREKPQRAHELIAKLTLLWVQAQ